MMILALILLLLSTPAYAQGVAVVKSAAPTSNGGTQDFTVTGFGTPVCVMFFLSYGTSNGTAVDHAMLSFGFSDFTNHRGIAHVSEDSGTTTDTMSQRATTLITLLNTDQSTDGTATASTITDGVRLTWADAPPSAYLVTAVMFNASMFSNCTVGTLTPNASVDATASVSGLGWQPDLILAAYAGSTTNARTSFGMALNDGGVVQYSAGQAHTTALATTSPTSAMLSNRIAFNGLSLSTVASYELTSFDSGGFTLTTRDNTTAVNDVYYLAAKLAVGASAKLATCTSPTATGAHSCTGAGFTPTGAIMSHTAAAALGTLEIDGDAEPYGLSAFTSTTQSFSGVSDDDNVAAANTASMTSINPIRMIKDAADYMVATFTGWQSDGVDLNYTTTDGTARYRAVLFLKGVVSAATRRGRPIFFQ